MTCCTSGSAPHHQGRRTPPVIFFDIDIPLPAALRAEIEPLTEGSRHWGFISLANNETDLVTIVTPQ